MLIWFRSEDLHQVRSSIFKKRIEADKKSVSMKDLSASKEKKPELTYPDKESKRKSVKKKKKEEDLVSVIKRKRPVKNIEQSEDTSGNEDSGYVRTGLSGSGLEPAGPVGTFPYSFYVETLKAKITSNWYNPLSSSGISGRFLSVVYFRIFRNGTIGKLELVKKSGNRFYDLSTLRVIKEVIPFPPFRLIILNNILVYILNLNGRDRMNINFKNMLISFLLILLMM